MLARLRVSLSLALVALLSTAAAASAADFSDRTYVMLGTGALVLGLMAVLSVFYLLRHLLGLDRMAPPDPTADAAAGHH